MSYDVDRALTIVSGVMGVVAIAVLVSVKLIQ